MKVVWRIAYWAAQLLESPWRILDAEAYGGSADRLMAGCLVVHIYDLVYMDRQQNHSACLHQSTEAGAREGFLRKSNSSDSYTHYMDRQQNHSACLHQPHR
jgi:hypothetical protein